MSKSYKKNPVVKDCTGSKCLQWAKRQANKRVRGTPGLPSGKAFKKVYSSWDIHDYSSRQTFSQYLQERESGLKHYLNVYESVDAIPERIKNWYYDLNYKEWKKYYYWK